MVGHPLTTENIQSEPHTLPRRHHDAGPEVVRRRDTYRCYQCIYTLLIYSALLIEQILERLDILPKTICGRSDQGTNIKRSIRTFIEEPNSQHMLWHPCAVQVMQLCVEKALRISK